MVLVLNTQWLLRNNQDKILLNAQGTFLYIVSSFLKIYLEDLSFRYTDLMRWRISAMSFQQQLSLIFLKTMRGMGNTLVSSFLLLIDSFINSIQILEIVWDSR